MALKRKETVAGTENVGVGAAAGTAVVEPVVQTAAAAAAESAAAVVDDTAKPAAPEAVQGTPAAAETAVAVKPQAAAPVVAKPMAITGLVFDDVKDKFIAPFGTLHRLKASNGNVMNDKDQLLGEFVDVQMVSWNLIYVVGPCDNTAPTELVRYSYDNQTFGDGTGDTVADYIATLKEQGYDQAASKKYGEVVALLTGSAKPSDLIGELVQLQLSPTSLTAFEGYNLQLSFKLRQGLAAPESADLIRFAAEVATKGKNVWSKLVAQSIPKAAGQAA